MGGSGSGGHNLKSEIGNIYGRLRVMARAKNTPKGRAQWKCICEGCGQKITVAGDDLRRGHTVSCGCLRREQSATRMRENNPRREGGIG